MFSLNGLMLFIVVLKAPFGDYLINVFAFNVLKLFTEFLFALLEISAEREVLNIIVNK